MTVRGNALVVHSRNGPVNLIFLLILGAFLVRITGAVIVLARKGRHPAKDEPDSLSRLELLHF